MARYAEYTSVPAERTKAEIERLINQSGATSFMAGSSATEAVIAFEMQDRRVMFRLPMPDPKSRAFTHTPSKGQARAPAKAYEAWEQGCRSRWRALMLAIKAKLEAVEIGITTFEDEFMAHIVMPDGRTVSQHVRPKIAHAYETGDMPPLLPGPSA